MMIIDPPFLNTSVTGHEQNGKDQNGKEHSYQPSPGRSVLLIRRSCHLETP